MTTAILSAGTCGMDTYGFSCPANSTDGTAASAVGPGYNRAGWASYANFAGLATRATRSLTGSVIDDRGTYAAFASGGGRR